MTLFEASMSNAMSKLKLPSARVTAPDEARNADGNDGGVPVSANTVSVSATTGMMVLVEFGSLQADRPSAATDARPKVATTRRDFITERGRAGEGIEAYRLTHETSSDCSLDNPLAAVKLRTTFQGERECRRSANWSPQSGIATASKQPSCSAEMAFSSMVRPSPISMQKGWPRTCPPSSRRPTNSARRAN